MNTPANTLITTYDRLRKFVKLFGCCDDENVNDFVDKLISDYDEIIKKVSESKNKYEISDVAVFLERIKMHYFATLSCPCVLHSVMSECKEFDIQKLEHRYKEILCSGMCEECWGNEYDNDIRTVVMWILGGSNGNKGMVLKRKGKSEVSNNEGKNK